MGKDLKGKDLGRGLSQRKDGKYSARFTPKSGKRKEKYFDKYQEAKRWLHDAIYEDEHGFVGSDMTVNTWFEYWIENIKSGTVRYNTVQNYRVCYICYVKEILGDIPIKDVKPLNCQLVLNCMYDNGYAPGTIQQTRITMLNMFGSAFENEFIQMNPVKKTVKCKSREKKERRVLTLEEQKRFLEEAKGTLHYDVFAFALQTGMRVGEIMGLKWEDIDFKKRIIKVQRTLQFRSIEREFVFGDPKSAKSKREIPMTDECIKILKLRKKVRNTITNLAFKDLVFYNQEGLPTKNSAYDSAILRISNRIDGMDGFSMHTLRHTFATRCIEAGMKPKTLQSILGHSSISMTMDLYVHTTDEEKHSEIKKLSLLA